MSWVDEQKATTASRASVYPNSPAAAGTSHQRQAQPTRKLESDHEEFLGLEHLDERAPQWLERPRQQQQTGVKVMTSLRSPRRL